MSASVVLSDYALTQGIDATPRDLALWASAQPGPIGALGVEALGEGAAPCRPVFVHKGNPKMRSLCRGRTGIWTRSGSMSRSGELSFPGSGSRVRSRSLVHNRSRSLIWS